MLTDKNVKKEKEKMKKVRVLAWILILAFILSACGGSSGGSTTAAPGGPETQAPSGEKKKDITILMPSDITGFDPWAASSVYNQLVLWQMYDRLYELDEDKKPSPQLTKEAKMISDTEWEIKIKEEAKFSDNTPLTSKDVAASITRGIESGLGGAIFKPLQSCEVIDEHTVKITTATPYPQLPVALCQLIACIVPADYLAQATSSGDWSNPIGSNRYKFGSRIPGTSVTLVRNENYWNPADAAKNESLTYKIVPEASTRTIMIQTGEADLSSEFSTADMEIVKNDNKVKVYSHKSSVMVFMPLNCEYEPFTHKEVRQALNYAVNRDNVLLVNANGYGTTNYTYLSPTCYGWLDNPSGYSYNVDKAKELLKQGGYEGGFSFDLYVTQAFTAAGTQIQSDLKAIGITVNIKMMESLDDVVKLASDGAHAMITTWGANPEPTLVLPRLVGESALGAYNLARYVNPALEELWAGGYASQDVNERIPYYKQWQEILCEDCPWVPLYVGELFCLATADLQGVQMNTEQIFKLHELHY